MITVEYSSNNSGGDWWLNDDHWLALEAAGWIVDWAKDRDDGFFSADSDGRWLGALATSASKEVEKPADAVAEWERITGQIASEEGCNCCGPPHNFSFVDDGGNYHYTEVSVVETKLDWF